jgi:nitrogen regulatory protein P-II 2
MYKQITLVLKPFRARSVLQAIAQFQPIVCLVREAKGYGRQKGYLNRYQGGDFSQVYLPKVEIVVWIESDRYPAFAERISKVARTGRIGDGKIFIVPMATLPANWQVFEF